ncbi:MAG: prenyltransferase/squalene oxidase repeat-containing protein [Planctomycetota bacterium]
MPETHRFVQQIPRALATLLASLILAVSGGTTAAQSSALSDAIAFLESQHDAVTGSWSPGTATYFEDSWSAYLTIASARSIAGVDAGVPDPMRTASTFADSLVTSDTWTVAVRAGTRLAAGLDAGADLATLFERQNPDGGWGATSEHESSVRDTAVVLRALLVDKTVVIPNLVLSDAVRFLRSTSAQVDFPVSTNPADGTRQGLMWSDGSTDTVLERVTVTARVCIALREISELTNGDVDVSDVLAGSVHYLENAIQSDGTPDAPLPLYNFEDQGVHDRALVLQALVTLGDPNLYGVHVTDILGDSMPAAIGRFWEDEEGSPITSVLTTARIASLLIATVVDVDDSLPDLAFASETLEVDYFSPSFTSPMRSIESREEMPRIVVSADVVNNGSLLDLGGVMDGPPKGSGVDLYVSLHDSNAYNNIEHLEHALLLEGATNEVIPAGGVVRYRTDLIGYPCNLYETFAIALDRPVPQLYPNAGFDGAIAESNELNNQLFVTPDYQQLLPYVLVTYIEVEQWFDAGDNLSDGIVLAIDAGCAGGPVPAGASLDFEFEMQHPTTDLTVTSYDSSNLPSDGPFNEIRSEPFQLVDNQLYTFRINTIVTLDVGTANERALRILGQPFDYTFQQQTAYPDLEVTEFAFVDSLDNVISAPGYQEPFRMKVMFDTVGPVALNPPVANVPVAVYQTDPRNVSTDVNFNGAVGPPLAEGYFDTNGALTIYLNSIYLMPILDELWVWIDTPYDFVNNGDGTFTYVLGDSWGLVPESNERNNLRRLEVSTAIPAADPFVRTQTVAVSPSDVDLAISPSFEISGVITNAGGPFATNGTATVALEIVDSQQMVELSQEVDVATEDLGSLGRGNVPVSFTWLPGSAGDRTLTLSVSYSEDANLENSTHTWTQTVNRTTVTTEFSQDIQPYLGDSGVGDAFSMSDPALALADILGIQIDVNLPDGASLPGVEDGQTLSYECALLDSAGLVAAHLGTREDGIAGAPAHKFVLLREALGTIPPGAYRARGRLVLDDGDGTPPRVIAEDIMQEFQIGNTVLVSNVFPIGPSEPIPGGTAFNDFFGGTIDRSVRVGVTSITNSPSGLSPSGTIEFLVFDPDAVDYIPVTGTNVADFDSFTPSTFNVAINDGFNSEVLAEVVPAVTFDPASSTTLLEPGNYLLRFTLDQDSSFRDDNAVPGEPLGTGSLPLVVEGLSAFTLSKRVFRAGTNDPATGLAPEDGERIRVEITIRKTSNE